jgi:CO dehydrogenase/acetyl-CoA synthase alpha subunit
MPANRLLAHNALIQVDGVDGELITLREWSVMDSGSLIAGHNVTRGQVAPQPQSEESFCSRRIHANASVCGLCCTAREVSRALAALTLGLVLGLSAVGSFQ